MHNIQVEFVQKLKLAQEIHSRRQTLKFQDALSKFEKLLCRPTERPAYILVR